MKQAIAGMGKLGYLATKIRDEEKGRLVKEFKFGTIDSYEVDFGSVSGTEISINNVKPIVNINPQSITKTLVPYIGARYRKFLKPENKLIVIEIFIKDKDSGNVLYSWNVEEVKPIYFHPSERKNKPVFYCKSFSGVGWKAELTFGYAPSEEEFSDLGIEAPPKYHPYHVSLNKQGLDVILHGRVILFHQLSELGIITARHPDYNSIRGEIILLEGFKTAITKNSIIQDKHFIECINNIRAFLVGDGEEDTKNYIKTKKYPDELPEALLRDRLSNWLLNNPLNKKINVKTEYTVGGLAGAIDILADNEAWELKRDQANGLDVYQLFAYMDMGQIDKGFLIAQSFATGAEAAADFIKQNHKKEIILAALEQFPINHHPTDEERSTYY